MSDLYERLHNRIAELRRHLVGCSSCTTCESSALGRLADAVLELHKPVQAGDGRWYCDECSHFDRHPTSPTPCPCETVRVIARALDVPTEGDQREEMERLG